MRDEAAEIGRVAATTIKGKKRKSAPPVEFFIAKLVKRCSETILGSDILDDCRRLIPFVEDLDKQQVSQLVKAIDEMLDRGERGFRDIQKALKSGKPNELRKLLEA